jgi:hypothetical protein
VLVVVSVGLVRKDIPAVRQPQARRPGLAVQVASLEEETFTPSIKLISHDNLYRTILVQGPEPTASNPSGR